MNKRILAVLVGTLLALVAATVWVPVIDDTIPYRYINRPATTPLEDYLIEAPSDIYLRPIWHATIAERMTQPEIVVDFIELTAVMERGGRDPRVGSYLQVKLLALTHGLILLIGGGLLTLAIRRNRRRRADARPSPTIGA